MSGRARTIPRLGMRRAVGAAAVGYTLLAGLENMDFLDVPGARAAFLTVARYYLDGGPALLGWLGALALGAYVVFVTGLVALLPAEERTRWPALLTLTAGVGGPGFPSWARTC
jgi:hypothetical protein